VKNALRLLIIQPLLPPYRLPLFLKLASLHKLTIAASNVDPELIKILRDSVRIHNCVTLSFLGLFFWQYNLLSISTHGTDVAIINFNPRYISTLLVAIRLRLHGITVYDLNHEVSSTSSVLGTILRNFLCSLICNGRISYTERETHRRVMLKNRLFAPAIVSSINNTLDIDSVSLNALPYSSQSRSGLLYIGRVTEKSNVTLLIKALPLLKHDARLHIIGEGDLIKSCKKLASSLNVCHRITWHGQIYDEHSISLIANKCRLFVYPGDVGLSCIHAMAYGLPCILHEDYRYHMPEFSAFQEASCGFTFVRNSIISLADVIDRAYCATPSLLNSLSLSAIAIVTQRYSIFHAVTKIDSLLN